jgi:hypothetical protein
LSLESGADTTFAAYVVRLDELWAAYFLRDVNLDIPHPEIFAAALDYPPYRSWREKVDPSVRFFLSNSPQKTAIWSNKRFSLAVEGELDR